MKKPSKGIASWPEDGRSRERLLSRSSHSLTELDVALIAEGVVDSMRLHIRTIMAKALQTNALELIAIRDLTYNACCIPVI